MRHIDPMKRAAILGVCLAAVVIAVATVPANAALVGYWKLDETTGTIAADSSGNGRNGELKDGPAWDAGGVLDGAIGLDGLNDRIHVLYDVDLTYTGGDLTLSTWVYVNPGETSGSLISKPWNWSGRYNYRLYLEGTRIGFGLANAAYPTGSLGVAILSPSYSSFAGTWHHVAGVVDSANNMSLYVDGNEPTTGTNTISDWTGTNSSLPLALGTLFPYPAPWAGVASHALDGNLDDVAIWNDALDPAKIKSIYNVPTTLGLSYDLEDMISLWSIYDAGAGAVGSVDQTPWQYTSALPGSPPAAGGAYTYGNVMYIVLGSGDGLTSSVATNWVGGGSDNNWSTAANWDPAINDPNGCDLHYDNGVAVDVTKLSATLDRDYTVASMRLNNLSATYETEEDPNGDRLYAFEIPAGITLTVAGAVDIGFRSVVSPANSPPNLRNRYSVTGRFTGEGKMVIQGPVTIRNTGCSWSSLSATAPATLDASGLSEFTVDTTGNIEVGGQNVGWGELILASSNLLRATNILVPGGASNTSVTPTSRLHLGQQNTLNADVIFVGGRGLNGEMFFQDSLVGPTVTIRDYSGTGSANLYIGDMVDNARPIFGTVDFTGGIVDAQFDQVHLGIVDVRTSQLSSSYGATGTLSMSAGTITANDVLLGRTIDGTNPARSWADGILNVQGGEFSAASIVLGQDDAGTARARGTINLTGGTLRSDTIQKGVGSGEAVFNWTGGTLHVGTFGSSEKPIPLIQNGGTLAPGNSVGTTTVYGDYTQASAGTLQIEIAGTGNGGTDFDLVEVHGNALLAGWLEVSLLDGFLPELGDSFDVLSTTGTLNIAGLQLTGDPPSPSFGWWEVAAISDSGGEGMILRLSAVPEPSSLVMVLLAMGLLVTSRRRGTR